MHGVSIPLSSFCITTTSATDDSCFRNRLDTDGWLKNSFEMKSESEARETTFGPGLETGILMAIQVERIWTL